ncbi:MAG: 2-octaprenyl-6-methoxyphenyl hydroxylase, partial [uncultured bacterium]
LDAYHRRRHLDVKARVAGIDALNRASMIDGQMLRDLRAGALNALYSIAPVRKTLMKAGIGVR